MNEQVRDLLERATEGPVAGPPITELLATATRQRRRRWSGLVVASAGLTAVIIVVVAVVVGGRQDVSRRRPLPPSPAGPGYGASVSQLVHGTWHPIPAPPTHFCETGSAVVSTGASALVVDTLGSPRCPAATAIFSPRTNTWRSLAPPPRALRGSVPMAALSGSSFVVTAGADTAALLDLRTNHWRILPRPPVSIAGATVVAARSTLFFVGGDPARDQVASYDGRTWSALPALPHPGAQLVNVAAYAGRGGLWAVVTDETMHAHGFSSRSRILRLGADGWVARPKPPAMPLNATSIMPLGGSELVVGNDCPPYASCPYAGAQLAVAQLRNGTARSLPVSSQAHSPTRYVFLQTAVAAGTTIVGINATTQQDLRRVIHPGAALVYDPRARSWRLTPPSPWVRFSYGAVWTRHGLVELGSPEPHCGCNRAGAWLEPARH